MAKLLTAAWNGYHYLFEELTDPRTRSWILVAKPYQSIIIFSLYLMLVLEWGPRFMKNRPAYNLDKILIAHNAFQVFSCGYILFQGIKWGWGGRYKLFCEPVDYSTAEHSVAYAQMVYCYHLMKHVDLLDTIFMVFRKKFNQITFLHLYHHAGMMLLTWIAITYYPGGHATLIGLINCFVHMVMYSYYLMCVVVPNYKEKLWMKKYITQLQIAQFVWNEIHLASLIIIPDCEYPRWIVIPMIPQTTFMLVLFMNFYIKTYHKKAEPKSVITINMRKETGGFGARLEETKEYHKEKSL